MQPRLRDWGSGVQQWTLTFSLFWETEAEVKATDGMVLVSALLPGPRGQPCHCAFPGVRMAGRGGEREVGEKNSPLVESLSM